MAFCAGHEHLSGRLWGSGVIICKRSRKRRVRLVFNGSLERTLSSNQDFLPGIYFFKNNFLNYFTLQVHETLWLKFCKEDSCSAKSVCIVFNLSVTELCN